MDGAHLESTLVFAYDGKIGYFINCQHTQQHAAQVKRACDQILSTFRAGTTR